MSTTHFYSFVFLIFSISFFHLISSLFFFYFAITIFLLFYLLLKNFASKHLSNSFASWFWRDVMNRHLIGFRFVFLFVCWLVSVWGLVMFSILLHKQSLFCHQIQWQCIYRPLIYHNLIPMMILSTIKEIFIKSQFNQLSTLSKLKTYLEDGCTIWCSPCIQQVIFACWHKPFATWCKLQTQHTTLMQM